MSDTLPLRAAQSSDDGGRSRTRPVVKPRLELKGYRRWLRITDIAIVMVALLMAELVATGTLSVLALIRGDLAAASTTMVAVSVVTAIGWLISLNVYDSYRYEILGAGVEEPRYVIRATFFVFAVLAIVAFVAGLPIARWYLAVALLIGMGGLLLGRRLWRNWLTWQRHHGHLMHKVLVVGHADGIRNVATTLAGARNAGYEAIAACTDDPRVADEVDGIPVIGRELSAAMLARTVNADVVACAAKSSLAPRQLRELSWGLEGTDIQLMLVPELTDVAGPRIHTQPVNGVPLLTVTSPEFSGRQLLLKTAMDKVLSGLALVVFAPLFLVIAVLIKLEDRGPVFFRQTRVGINGSTFTMIKFRSMVVNAEALKAQVEASGAGADTNRGPMFKAKHDPRITKVGRILRKTSLDELPQIINIFKGEMSVVGPRPPLPKEVAQYTAAEERRLLLKPGLTGLWQVNGRSDLSWEESIRFDLYYVENWSLLGDIAIILRTVHVVLAQRGAY